MQIGSAIQASVQRRAWQLFAAALVAACTTTWVAATNGEDPFAAAVRPTEALSPKEQEKTFHLPPGFKIDLFAAEPDVQKPMNMAFDAKGRLWVSGSVEYPFAAALEKPGRDTIKILADTDGDGRADKVTTFADGLNIPIGLYPYRNGVIAFSIPNIYFLEDTNGDDHADKRHKLFGPLDYTRDTHGMNNAFRRGLDGWIYACHGYQNRDTISARDGSRVVLEGGGTYRFRPDGERAELFTRGQVNPFGMTMDSRGDWFSADCHTKPIMLLLRGGCYENFGAPDDGLGFVPPVMMHTHGSTAIAGTTVYEADNFPPEYRGNMFAGNVMTSRVNRDSMTFQGSSVIAHEEPDFITTDDPWFRPVDLQVGPDGALYIADFYNRIIGHYEVPLDHPGRDRERGRIWRVTYVGDDKNTPKHMLARDLTKAVVQELIAALSSRNLTLRLRATDELSDRCGEEAIPLLRETVAKSPAAAARVHALWALFRANQLTPSELLAATQDSTQLVRVHANRIIAETGDLNLEIKLAVKKSLTDPDGFVRRAAVDALGQHPELDAVPELLDLVFDTADEDVHLRHMARIALRRQLRPTGRLARLKLDDLNHLSIVADVALGIETAEAGSFLAEYVARFPVDDKRRTACVTHAARYMPADKLDAMIDNAKKQFPDDLERQVVLIEAIDQGVQLRGMAVPTMVIDWAADLAPRLFVHVEPMKLPWVAKPAGLKGQRAWPVEERFYAGGTMPDAFLSSLPWGERYAGVLRSAPFAIPAKMEFFVCGHLGPADGPPISKNLVRLKLSANDQVIAQCFAPRNDVAQRTSWDLQTYEGQEGYVEVVDGVTTNAYAWIAVGRFHPGVVPVSGAADLAAHRLQSAVKLVARLKLVTMSDRVIETMLDQTVGLETQAVAAQSFVALHPHLESAALAERISDDGVADTIRTRILQAIASRSDERVKETLGELMRSAPERLQRLLALKLAEHPSSAATLLSMLEHGAGTPRLLQDETIVQKLRLAKPDDAPKRIQALITDLPADDEELQKLIAQRQQNYWTTDASAARGEEVYAKHCMACHQLRGRGTTIAPQLDGIGTRGGERVIEDILDPNRNVDLKFQTSVYVLNDGRVLSGLFRRTEGPRTIVADLAGKEVSFPTADIEEEQKSKSSLMPNNFGALLTEAEFMDLVAMLCDDRQPK
jgi:putative heme-binding domain-containing protein